MNCRKSTRPGCSQAPSPTRPAIITCARSSGRTKWRWKTLTGFPPILSELDLYLLGEGTHMRLYDKLGAHSLVLDGVAGVGFAVFAPNARRVSVVGDFNFWDGRRHAMRVRGNGYWEIFIPKARPGDKYKYEILGANGELLPLKSDPGRVWLRVAAIDRLGRGRQPKSFPPRSRCRKDATR